MGLPLNELAAIVQARSALAKHGKSINDAAGFYLDHLERIKRCNITVAQLAAEVLAAKQKDGFGVLYLTDLRKRLNRFARDFGTRPIAAITIEELDDWLRNLECAPKTRANFRANIGVLFSYAERRRMICPACGHQWRPSVRSAAAHSGRRTKSAAKAAAMAPR